VIHPIEAEESMAYLDGELLMDRAATAAAHLERCRDCQGLAADLQGVSQRLRAWQVEPSGSGSTPASLPRLMNVHGNPSFEGHGECRRGSGDWLARCRW
jgi:anti-sigma factor RsiW